MLSLLGQHAPHAGVSWCLLATEITSGLQHKAAGQQRKACVFVEAKQSRPTTETGLDCPPTAPIRRVCCPVPCALFCRHVVNASGLSWNAGDMDFTGGQMVLTLKLIGMAVSFQDAHSKQKEVRGGPCCILSSAGGWVPLNQVQCCC